jgi:hypothetical protein
MKQVRYAMHFRGSAEGVSEGVLRAKTGSSSTRIDSILGPDGVSCEVSPLDGEEARFTSEVRLSSTSTFDEDGTIDFGNGNTLRFSTIGQGHLEQPDDDGLTRGCVMWKIDSGTGQFEGATGLITSNFSLASDLEVNDHHFGVFLVK